MAYVVLASARIRRHEQPRRRGNKNRGGEKKRRENQPKVVELEVLVSRIIQRENREVEMIIVLDHSSSFRILKRERGGASSFQFRKQFSCHIRRLFAVQSEFQPFSIFKPKTQKQKRNPDVLVLARCLVVNYGRIALRNWNSGWFQSTTPRHRNSGGLCFGK